MSVHIIIRCIYITLCVYGSRQWYCATLHLCVQNNSSVPLRFTYKQHSFFNSCKNIFHNICLHNEPCEVQYMTHHINISSLNTSSFNSPFTLLLISLLKTSSFNSPFTLHSSSFTLLPSTSLSYSCSPPLFLTFLHSSPFPLLLSPLSPTPQLPLAAPYPRLVSPLPFSLFPSLPFSHTFPFTLYFLH